MGKSFRAAFIGRLFLFRLAQVGIHAQDSLPQITHQPSIICFMNKFITLVAAALMAMNVSAEDKPKKGKGAKLNPAYQQLLADLKLTDEQKPKFQALQKEQSAFTAEQKKRSAEEKKAAGQPFYKARTAKIKELFNQDQLKVWWKYQAEQRAARQKKSQ